MLESLLASFGASLTANAVYDVARRYFTTTQAPTVQGFQDYLASNLSVDGASILAERIVEFFARNGNITVVRSSVAAGDQITMASFPGTQMTFGHGSVSRTDKTSIETGPGAYVKMQGGARIVQDSDGSIKFYT